MDATEQRLAEDAISAKAKEDGLPSVEVCSLKEPQVRFVRLRAPKEEGQSLKKKQCDLWEFCWGSSTLLAYVVTRTLNLDDKTTLEVGGGIGVSTLALASTYRTKLSVMTDLVPDALKIFDLSCSIASLKGKVVGKVLNWNKVDEFSFDQPFDFILGSDVLFMSWCSRPLANVMATCLAQNGLMMIVDPFRLNDELFLSCLSEKGINEHQVYEFPSSLIGTLLGDVLDDKGSVVPVVRAKLILASRVSIDPTLENVLVADMGMTRKL